MCHKLWVYTCPIGCSGPLLPQHRHYIDILIKQNPQQLPVHLKHMGSALNPRHECSPLASLTVDLCVCVCVYHLFVRNNLGTIEYRSINKNKFSDGLTGAECVNHSINITFDKPG